VIAALIRRPVGQGYAAEDIDNPGVVAAVAWAAADGWRVGIANGSVVASQLTKTCALNLMDRTARREIARSALRDLQAVHA
jgi:hypothetical protein